MPEWPFAGARRRMLSADAIDVDHTALARLDAGWSSDLAGPSPIELFLLSAAAEIGGRPLRPGGYLHVPSGAHEAQMTALAATDMVVMVDRSARPSRGPRSASSIRRRSAGWEDAVERYAARAPFYGGTFGPAGRARSGRA